LGFMALGLPHSSGISTNRRQQLFSTASRLLKQLQS